MSFGMMEALLSFLRRQVGLRTDSADAAGSLHAKLKEARDTLINVELPKLSRPYSAITGSAYVSSESYVDVVNVTGRGVFLWAYAYRDTCEYGAGIQLVIDGSTVCTGEISSVKERYYLIHNFLTTVPIVLQVPFKSSLVLQARYTTGLNNPNIYWCYAKE